MVEIEIDGKKVEVPAGSMVMDAANKLGTYIPHFCYHKKLSIAANCRMCLVEVEKEDLVDLPEIVEILRNRPECFIVFCDDLSFEAAEPGYKSLKVVLDGSISSTSDNVVVYATSNRRHLMPEFMAENLQTQYVGEEIRPGDTTEEKVSLSERFGLWLSFYAFDQDEYLKVAQFQHLH